MNYETILVETFSHEKSAGRLCLNLAEKLQAKGVQMRPLPVDQVFDILAEQGRINPFTQLVTTFLNHFKGGQRSLDFLKRHLPKDADRARCLAFLEIFDHIFQRYQAHPGG